MIYGAASSCMAQQCVVHLCFYLIRLGTTLFRQDVQGITYRHIPQVFSSLSILD